MPHSHRPEMHKEFPQSHRPEMGKEYPSAEPEVLSAALVQAIEDLKTNGEDVTLHNLSKVMKDEVPRWYRRSCTRESIEEFISRMSELDRENIRLPKDLH